MDERSVAVEASAPEPDAAQPGPDLEGRLGAFRDEVAERGGVPLRSSDGRRYGARFCITAPDPATAVEEGVDVFRQAESTAGLEESAVLDVEAPTLDELGQRSSSEVPDLLDITLVAEMLGVDHRMVTILVRSRGFPAPAAELHAGPVWTRRSIVDFLRRRDPDCEQCGFIYANVAPETVPVSLRERAGRYQRALAEADDDELRARPATRVWSALEYACHVRDVLEVQRDRLGQALTTDRPEFEPMGRDERVERDGYNQQDPVSVAAGLVDAAERMASVLEGLDAGGWARTAVYNWPRVAERNMEWVARHTLHEVEHHFDDMERALAATRQPTAYGRGLLQSP
ncbi:MAG: DinB family protein [Actinomycetota bacterium]|nr:DinB family protein [Actinomycetota bacterium]